MLDLEINSNDEKRMELYLCNCSEILKCSDCCVLLSLSTLLLKITGFSLLVSAYSNGEVYVEGEITKIEFESSEKDVSASREVA